MRKFPLSLLFAVIALGFSSAAHAEYHWLSAGQFGAKPDRVEVLIDIGSVKADEDGPFGARESFITLPILVIYESSAKPDYSRVDLRVFCGTQPHAKTANAFTYWRNDTTSEDIASIAFTPAAGFTQSLIDLICGDQAVALASGQFKQIPAESANEAFPIDYPWKKVWLDNKRPAYTSTRTRAEKDAEFDRKMAEAKAMLANGEAMALGQIEKSNAEDDFWKDQVRRRRDRPKSRLNASLESWLRKDEEYIIQTLGMPDSAYNAGNTRILFYDSRGNWTQKVTTTDQNGNVLSSSQYDYVCSLTLELRNNQLIDFKLQGNSCGYGEFGGR